MMETCYDIFVKGAHADDENPCRGQERLGNNAVAELNKVLRRKLGGSGVRI